MFPTLRGLLKYGRSYWPCYLLGTLAVLVTNLCDLTTTFIVKYSVNLISGSPGGGGVMLGWLRGVADRSGLHLLIVFGGGFVLLVVLQGGFRYLWRWGFVMSSLRIARTMRSDLFGHLQQQEHAYFDRVQTGELLSVATADVEAMRMFLGIGALLFVDTVLYFMFVPYLMFSINPWVTLAVMLPLPLVPLLTNKMGLALHRRFTACQEQLASISARAQESMAGIAVVKQFVQSQNETRSFETLSRESWARQVHLAKVQSLFMPLLTLVVSTEIFLVIWFGASAVMARSLDAGELFQMLMLTLMLTFPMMELGWTMTLYQRGAASFQRYREVMDCQPGIVDDPALIDRDAVAGTIEFRGLNFTFPGAQSPALRGIDLEIPAGSTVALVGPVGSGKSALAGLVPRFYEAPEGQVLIDGADLRRFPLHRLRESIGYVPQDTFLFSVGIEQNIALGVHEFTREQVEQAAQVAGLTRDLGQFSEGYDTLLGERGVNLSGGQRQRVAIARAVIKKPKILVLDDCLSSVDTRTEALILSQLKALMKGQTGLLIAHRLSTVQHADMICVMSGGKIVERGTHDELLVLGGWYASTYRQQQLEQEYAGSEEAC